MTWQLATAIAFTVVGMVELAAAVVLLRPVVRVRQRPAVPWLAGAVRPVQPDPVPARPVQALTAPRGQRELEGR